MDSESVKTEGQGRQHNMGMTTEPVRGGSGLEHGGGSSRGRDRQDNRDPVT